MPALWGHTQLSCHSPGLPGVLGGRAVSVFIFVVTAGGGGTEKDSLWQANSQKGSAVFSFHIHRVLGPNLLEKENKEM